ncbi:hypothetical protein [Dyella sp. A6]|uniref:hypothetical protein n=1 Tax=Dyella aluminiiresistens TaxID=3069105 RepID=UPI002E788A01|nr:hypothetical protein [Dyella sp. A6]
MPIIYATRRDAEAIRTWINDSADVAWIVKSDERGKVYKWRAVRCLETLEQQRYAIWHIQSGSLNIPSGHQDVPDQVVDDAFWGWTQSLDYEGATCPWFGANLPGPYHFTFAEDGCEASGNLARSEFSWAIDHYKSIGKSAHPEAKKWWRALIRFLDRSAEKIPLVESLSNRARVPTAYVFPQAAEQIRKGRKRDINPWLPSHDL